MSNRWLSGSLIFALGFGCASVGTIVTAQDSIEEGVVEEGLGYVNTADKFKLVNSGDQYYVVAVSRRPDVLPAEPPVSYTTGGTTISKIDLNGLAIYRLTPVGELAEGIFRPCNPEFTDCPIKSPLPPPPSPEEPVDLTAEFLFPQ